MAAAIEILDAMADGMPAEQALTRWARRSRFAGSKDRAAIRDHVFDVLRQKRTAAHYGRGETGRALMLGQLYAVGAEIEPLFDAVGHAPAPLDDTERAFPEAPTDQATLWNMPDWLMAPLQASLGEKAARTARALQARAPVFLRVNPGKATRQTAQQMLAQEGIATAVNPLADTALTVLEGARKIRNSSCFADGIVELQDAASQAVVQMLPTGIRVLDYCAGGGGKALAIAAQGGREVFAHDADPRRMSDLAARVDRAGTPIVTLAAEALEDHAPFDIVLCDAPCSGSGAWRRSAEGKWALTPERLAELTEIQDQILARAADLVGPDGTLAYATCSVLRAENEDRIAAFLDTHAGWSCVASKRFDVSDDGDGFFAAHLKRVDFDG